jgi:hypothetical protein
MAEQNSDSNVLPAPYRAGFAALAQRLLELAADDLRGLCAFGGWLINDPFFEGTPARSVAVLKRIDLQMLDELASAGARLGRQHLRAPLIMTAAYIEASCDTFPLELLEIKQLHAVVHGEDHFGQLGFERNDVRLQCERELKSELIQLRQGLLAAAGKHKLLHELCLASAERTVRILRGVLLLSDGTAEPATAQNVIARAAEATERPLDGLLHVVSRPAQITFDEFERVYEDVAALTTYVDELTGG